jgi:hypothetical protein
MRDCSDHGTNSNVCDEAGCFGPPKPKGHVHNFVDRVVRLGGWNNVTRMIIYCKGCGKVSYDHYL